MWIQDWKSSGWCRSGLRCIDSMGGLVLGKTGIAQGFASQNNSVILVHFFSVFQCGVCVKSKTGGGAQHLCKKENPLNNVTKCCVCVN